MQLEPQTQRYPKKCRKRIPIPSSLFGSFHSLLGKSTMAAASAARSLLRSSVYLLGATPSRPSSSSLGLGARPFIRRALAAPPPQVPRFVHAPAPTTQIAAGCDGGPCYLRRLPVEACFCMDSLLPLHSATAATRLKSMLAVPGQAVGWLTQGKTTPDLFIFILYSVCLLFRLD